MYQCIEAKDVEVGDRIYDSLAEQPVFRWILVLSVERVAKDQVKIETGPWYTIKHPREGIGVERQLGLGQAHDTP